MIHGKNIFDKPVKSYIKSHENVRESATGQKNDYITGYLFDYPYFKENCYIFK